VLCDNTTSPLILANNSSALRAQHCVTVVILARFYELILWMTAIDAAMLSERSDSSFFAALRMVPSVINGQSHPPHSSGPTESYLVTTEVPPLQPLNTVAPPPFHPPCDLPGNSSCLSCIKSTLHHISLRKCQQ